MSVPGPASTPTQPRRHIVQLDGLRAIAALLVLVEHFALTGEDIYIAVGKSGVWLFFVLSGYLITDILLRVRGVIDQSPQAAGRAWVTFYSRRILRLWPLYYSTIAVAALMGLEAVREQMFYLLAHCANLGIVMKGNFTGALAHFWSLAVEEQFYLVWPLIVFLAPRKILLPLAAAAVLLTPAFRLLVLSLTNNHYITYYVLMPSCLDGLGMGAVLALTARVPEATRRKALRAGLLAGCAMLAVILARRIQGSSGRLGMSMEGFALSLIFAWLVDRATAGFSGVAGRVLELRPLLYIGKISYGVYVLHFPLRLAIQQVEDAWRVSLGLPRQPGLGLLLYMTAVTLALASASWYLMEEPVLRLKRYFEYPTPQAREVAEARAVAEVRAVYPDARPQA